MNIDSDISDKIFLADLKKEFEKSVISSISDIKSNLKNKNYEEIRKIVHNIKGISGAMGFPEGSDISKKILAQILKADYEELEVLISELINYLSNTVLPELNIEEKKRDE